MLGKPLILCQSVGMPGFTVAMSCCADADVGAYRGEWG